MEINRELNLIEQKRNVYGAFEFIEDEDNQTLNNYLRVLFVLLDFLVDGQCTQEQHDFFQ